MKLKNKRVFIISDTHFGQESFYKHNPKYEITMRPEFSSAKECDDFVINTHNKLVPEYNSVVYFLGDIAWNIHAAEDCISRMNGEFKILVAGNHDSKFPTFKLMQLFDKICGACYLGNREYLLTHVPIHTQELRNGIHCWHGHTHRKSVDDPRYRSFCLEVNNYSTVEVTDLLNKPVVITPPVLKHD